MFGERPVAVTALRPLQQLFVAAVEHNFFSWSQGRLELEKIH
jgi:hypothetical protein